ncbi:MAG: hypothetical protein NUV60_03560 [Patescibacteria group bacterium]|nr:hypothetical protein [Patescibacteria group bacterium]
MASIVFSAPSSTDNERMLEEFRTELQALLGKADVLVKNGLFIGEVMRDPAGMISPTVSVVVQCWGAAETELQKFAGLVMEKNQFDGLSVIGLE